MASLYCSRVSIPMSCRWTNINARTYWAHVYQPSFSSWTLLHPREAQFRVNFIVESDFFEFFPQQSTVVFTFGSWRVARERITATSSSSSSSATVQESCTPVGKPGAWASFATVRRKAEWASSTSHTNGALICSVTRSINHTSHPIFIINSVRTLRMRMFVDRKTSFKLPPTPIRDKLITQELRRAKVSKIFVCFFMYILTPFPGARGTETRLCLFFLSLTQTRTW